MNISRTRKTTRTFASVLVLGIAVCALLGTLGAGPPATTVHAAGSAVAELRIVCREPDTRHLDPDCLIDPFVDQPLPEWPGDGQPDSDPDIEIRLYPDQPCV